MGMGTLFFVVGALLKTYPPASTPQPNPPASGRAMAAMIYIYVCFYSIGWGPLPWVYASDIFPTRTRHYGMAVASSSQWLWSEYFSNESYVYRLVIVFVDYVVAKVTPTIHTRLGYKMFLMFATLNVGAMAPFSLYSSHLSCTENDTYILAVLFQKRKDALSKKWILYSVPLVRTTALRILRGENKARISLKFHYKLLYSSKTTEIVNVGVHADLEQANSINDKGDER